MIQLVGSHRLILASRSPRRLALLRDAGIEPAVREPLVDESERPNEPPEQLVERLAAEKAREVARRLERVLRRSVVLGADTEVALDGRALGKPSGADEARAMLRALAGRAHDVLTGVHLLRADDGRSTSVVVRTRVTFHPYDDRTIDDYVRSGEPLDKAGAYGIQGRAGAFVTRIAGSYSGIMGLPLAETAELLDRFEIPLT
jgi:nucleoside triphosphate pyrophosphatase